MHGMNIKIRIKHEIVGDLRGARDVVFDAKVERSVVGDVIGRQRVDRVQCTQEQDVDGFLTVFDGDGIVSIWVGSSIAAFFAC